MLSALPAVAIDGAKAVGKTSSTTQAGPRASCDSTRDQYVRSSERTRSPSCSARVPIDRRMATRGRCLGRRTPGSRRGPYAGPVSADRERDPRDGATAHSGAGRITRLRMRPLAFSEQGIYNSICEPRRAPGRNSRGRRSPDIRLSHYVEEIMASAFPDFAGCHRVSCEVSSTAMCATP